MVNLSGSQFDYCIFQCFSTSMSTQDIYKVIYNAIHGASMYHFTIIAIIGDGAQANRQFQKRFFQSEVSIFNGVKFSNCMLNPIYNNPIFYISDPSHSIKKITSSMSSSNRKIHINIDGKDKLVSLNLMKDLWLSFLESSGLNTHPEFKMTDFVKNSFQAMRVGPCMKVLGPKMTAMIDHARLYKVQHDDFECDSTQILCVNPWIRFKNATEYDGIHLVSEMFGKLFSILNSTTNRLNTNHYSHNVEYLEVFLLWFKSWKEECINRTKLHLPAIHTAYQSMTGFFTAEASDDCVTMVEGIIHLTRYYCSGNDHTKNPIYIIPRRISQDLVENGFARVRLAASHGRLDHRTTAAACVESNMIKEIKRNDRRNKKRNAGDGDIEEKNVEVAKPDSKCTEYASECYKAAVKMKNTDFDEFKPFTWALENGKLFLKVTKF